MANVCIQFPTSIAVPNPIQATVTPIFTPGPEADAWDDWLFGPDASSLIGLVSGQVLASTGVQPSFHTASVQPADQPNGLASTLPERSVLTQIVAFEAPGPDQKMVCGSLSAGGIGSPYGTGISWNGPQEDKVQFQKRTASSTVAVRLPTAAGVVAGDIVVAALVDDDTASYGYVHGVTGFVSLGSGPKLLALDRFPGIGNLNNTTPTYLTSAAINGYQLYADQALAESIVRQKMARLYNRVMARKA